MVVLGAGLGLLIAASSTAVVMSRVDDEAGDSNDSTSSAVNERPEERSITWRADGQVQIPYGSVDLDAAGDSVWVTNGDTLYRVARSTMSVVDSVELIGAAYNVSASADSVWVVNNRPFEEVMVVDPDTGETSEAEYISLPNDVDLEAGAAWVLGLSSCGRLDPVTATVTLECSVGGESIDATDDDVWIVGDGLSRLDPQTGAVVDSTSLPGAGTAVAATRDVVWVVVDSETSTDLLRIDPTDLAITGTIEVGAAPEDGYPQGLFASEADVWVTNSTDGTLFHVDPQTVQITQTLNVGTQPRGVTATGEEVWVADDWAGPDGETGVVHRVVPDGSNR